MYNDLVLDLCLWLYGPIELLCESTSELERPSN